MRQMFPINPSPQQPRRLVLQPKDPELTAAFPGFGLALSLVACHFLLVRASTVTDQEHFLQTPIVPLGASDDKCVAVCQCMRLREREQRVEGRETAAGRWRQYLALHNLRTIHAGMQHHASTELLVHCELGVDHR